MYGWMPSGPYQPFIGAPLFKQAEDGQNTTQIYRCIDDLFVICSESLYHDSDLW